MQMVVTIKDKSLASYAQNAVLGEGFAPKKPGQLNTSPCRLSVIRIMFS